MYTYIKSDVRGVCIDLIIGIGTDIIRVERIAKLLEKYGPRFLDKVFTAAEQQWCQKHDRPAERLAVRFAAKEATMKALGTGWSRGILFRDIEVEADNRRRPRIHLHGYAAQFAQEHNVSAIHLSLTHEEEYAVAVVVLETNLQSIDTR